MPPPPPLPPPPRVVLSIRAIDDQAAEPIPLDKGFFEIRSSVPVPNDLFVSVSYSGTAVGGEDYFEPITPVFMQRGSRSITISITPREDLFTEGTETIVATLVETGSYDIGEPGSAVVEVLDGNPNGGGGGSSGGGDGSSNGQLPIVTIWVEDSDATEPSPEDVGTFRVTRSGPTNSPLSVRYQVSGSATGDLDYEGLSGTIVIPAQSASATITVTPLHDAIVEGNETVMVSLIKEDTYDLGSPRSDTVLIRDNDEPPDGGGGGGNGGLPVVSIRAGDDMAYEPEPAKSATFVVTRTGSTSSSLTVSYFIGGSATNGTDYDELTGTVTIPSGATTTTILINPHHDALIEGNEDVTLTLIQADHYNLGSPKSDIVLIVDNDPPNGGGGGGGDGDSGGEPPIVTITATDAVGTEPIPIDKARFTVRRTGSTQSPLTVNYQTGGSATPGVDYHLLPGSVTIPANETSVIVEVEPIDDPWVEHVETVVVSLIDRSHYDLGNPSWDKVYILDNDRRGGGTGGGSGGGSTPVPVVTISASDADAHEPGANNDTDKGRFTVTRQGSSAEKPLTVLYTVKGSATAGLDYEPLNGTVVIPIGQMSADFYVRPIDDPLVEEDETVIVDLRDASAYNLSLDPSLRTALVTVHDNDQPPPPPDPAPVVTIEAHDPHGLESGPDAGQFMVRRTGSTAEPLVVTYHVAGTATPGIDYQTLPGSLTIPAGASWAMIDVQVLDDLTVEGSEFVKALLAASSSYQQGAEKEAEIWIADNDREPNKNMMFTAQASRRPRSASGEAASR